MKSSITRTKIFIVWILTAAISFTIFPNNLVRATPETMVKVEPHASFAHVGETFTVNITVVNVQNLYGLEIDLEWNASILKLTNLDVRLGEPDGVLYGEIFSPYGDNCSICYENKCIITGTSESPAPSFNGSGTIARLTFNVTNVGSCELNLKSELASNLMTPTGVAPIPHTTINGFFGPIEIKVSPKTVTIGENVNVSGCIAPAKADVPVTILYRLNEEEWQTLETVNTDELGDYEYLWTPQKSGKYYVKSTAVILGSEETSSIISVIVNEPEKPSWVYVGITVVIIVGVIVALLLIYKRRIRR